MVGARVAMKASDWTTTFGDGRAPINVDQFHTVVHRVIKMPQTRGAPVKNIVLCNLIGEDIATTFPSRRKLSLLACGKPFQVANNL